jgi:hypothetical protein
LLHVLKQLQVDHRKGIAPEGDSEVRFQFSGFHCADQTPKLPIGPLAVRFLELGNEIVHFTCFLGHLLEKLKRIEGCQGQEEVSKKVDSTVVFRLHIAIQNDILHIN